MNLLGNSGFNADSHANFKALQLLVVGDLETSLTHMLVLIQSLSCCLVHKAVRPHTAPEYKDETMTVFQIPIYSEYEATFLRSRRRWGV